MCIRDSSTCLQASEEEAAGYIGPDIHHERQTEEETFLKNVDVSKMLHDCPVTGMANLMLT